MAGDDSRLKVVGAGRRAFPWLLALTLACALTPLNSALPTIVGAFAGCMLALMGIAGRRRFGRPALAAIVLFAATVVWFLVTSALAVSPATSLLGGPAVHRGAALWAVAAVWMVAGALLADSRTLRESLSVTAAAGVVFTGTAAWEALRATGQRVQGYPAGVFDNSNSLGSFLAVSAIAALALAFAARRPWTKAVSAAAAGVSVGGLLLASSRTGLLGVTAAVVFALLLVLAPSFRYKAPTMAGATVFLVVAITLGVTLVSVGMLGAEATAALDSASTQRDVIWAAAAARIGNAPLAGYGLDQFSAALPWSMGPTGVPSVVFTNDPHSMPLAVVLGGGAVGALLAGAAFFALLWAGAGLVDRTRQRWACAVTASIPVAVLGAGLVNWIAPVAMVAAFASVGALLGSGAGPDRASEIDQSSPEAGTVGRWSALTAGVATALLALASLGAGVLGVLALPSEVVYVDTLGSLFSPARLDPRQYDTSVRLASAYHAWPAPAIATRALEGLVPQVSTGSTAAVSLTRELVAETSRDAVWSSGLALRRMMAIEVLYGDRSAGMAPYEAAAEQGSQADSATGLWWALAAGRASRLGMPRRAAQYALRALQYPLDMQTEEYLTRLAGG